MRRRGLLKGLHWLAFGLIVYFFFDDPEGPGREARRVVEGGLSLHAGMGVLLAAVTLLWLALYWRGGPLGRPGPKLAPWAKRAHRVLNGGLYFALPAMVATGGLAGLLSEYPIRAFGVLPLNFGGVGTRALHDVAEDIHELAFDGLVVLVLAHTAFHVWRHLRLRDNALRIMAPKVLHRYL